MAVGPFARIAAQVIVPIIAVMARALPAAYGQALQNARKAGVNASTEAAAPVFGKRITRSEALQVLNVTEQEITADPKIIEKVCPLSTISFYVLASIFPLIKQVASMIDLSSPLTRIIPP